uniref:CCAAT-binding factor domain-containing protein n=1 Tax=Globisporangium ultimum (strain ATCC 200006 / CBS 805.95 / DAOM BR144) TaxID=431595 RepID=K3WFJ7_GLOUD
MAGATKKKTQQQQMKPKGKTQAQQPKGKAEGKVQDPKQQQQKKPKKHDSVAKPTTTAAAASSPAALHNMLAKLTEQSVSWYDALKPLKPVARDVSAAFASGNGNSKRKNKKLLALQLEKQAAGGAEDVDGPTLPAELVESKKKHAQRLWEEEVQRFEAKKSGKMSSDDKYLATMMKNGTLADRVAALTLTIQGSPFHCLSRLGQMITMASKKARRESMMAVDSLKDLFINNLLPDDRRLNFFHQNPLDHPDANDGHLVVWFFEHCLKTAFAQLVGVLADGMDDAVDNHKRACIRAANALLAAKPEQEAVLLAMLVNKLGDPDRKIASYIHKTLQDLLQEHSAMKRVVIDEVERVLTRPQVSDRTKYNAILFLNQIYLDKSGDDADLAAHLITVYFGLFTKEVHAEDARVLAAKKKEKHFKKGSHKKKNHEPAATVGMDRKLLSALLVGVNRAFPYAKATSANFEGEIDALFTVVHRAHHSTSVQALMLLFQVMNSTNSVSDRFYTALYEKLFDPKVRDTSKHTLFLNLIFRAMKADVSPARCGAMMKRLLQLTTVMTPAFTCAVLFLLSELLKIKPTLRTLIDQPESGSSGDPGDDEHFEDVKAESDDEEGEKQTFTLEQDDDDEDTDDESESPAEMNDGLTDTQRAAKVLEQMFGKAPAAGAKKNVPTAVTFDESSDEGEEQEEKNVSKEKKKAEGKGASAEAKSSAYDPRKRNPLFAGAENACAWELHHLVQHYHPSVQVFARQLIENKTTGIQYAGDPLVDFTMHAFFEKFMNKKPRHKIESGDQKAKKVWSFAPMNTEAVLQEAEENVDESDKFFYKFFKERASRESAVPKKKKRASSDDDRDADAFSDADSEEDAELEAYAQGLAEAPKRKSPFASADDYEVMVQEALAKQQKQRAGKKQKRN